MGNGAANQLHGQAGNDTLNGGGGDDTLTGWSGVVHYDRRTTGPTLILSEYGRHCHGMTPVLILSVPN
ncbi:hypothetical protein [Nitrosomonas sp.]|uniref:hypothetical protein n=1 Tax=Nitrosomonas sp. TaxID=42353 RepID=UPI00344ABEB4